MEKKSRLDEAAEQLTNILEKHLAGLSPKDREAKARAFERAVAKVGTRSKSEELPRTPATRRSVRRPA